MEAGGGLGSHGASTLYQGPLCGSTGGAALPGWRRPATPPRCARQAVVAAAARELSAGPRCLRQAAASGAASGASGGADAAALRARCEVAITKHRKVRPPPRGGSRV